LPTAEEAAGPAPGPVRGIDCYNKAMERNGRLAERLAVLRNACKDLWIRLEDVKSSLTDSDQLWTEKPYKLAREVLRKQFPEHPNLSELDNSQGPQELQTNSRSICERLEERYLAIFDFIVWKEDSWKLMTEICDDYDCPEYDENPDFHASFLEIFCSYVQLVLFVSQIQDRELLVSFYAYAYQYATGNAEVGYKRIADQLKEQMGNRALALTFLRRQVLEVPQGQALRRTPIQDYLARILTGQSAGSPGGILGAFISLSRAKICKEGSECFLGVMLRPDEVQFPSGLNLDTKEMFQFHNCPEASRMMSWMACCLIVCPYLIFRIVHGVELMKEVVKAGWRSDCRGQDLNVHEELYEIWHDKAFLSELEKAVTDKKLCKELKEEFRRAIEHSIITGPSDRAQRRIFLESALTLILHQLQDCPGLLGPHFPLVRAALALARDEIVWFVRHMAQFPQKNRVYRHLSKGAWVALDRVDYLDGVAALVSITTRLFEFATRHCAVARDYHLAQCQVLARLLQSDIAAAGPALQVVLLSAPDHTPHVRSHTTCFALLLFR
jgi:NCK-associated protein 1